MQCLFVKVWNWTPLRPFTWKSVQLCSLKKRSLGLKNNKRISWIPTKFLRVIYRNSLCLNSYTNNLKLKSFVNNLHRSFNLNSYECFYKQKFFRLEFLHVFTTDLLKFYIDLSVTLKILQVVLRTIYTNWFGWNSYEWFWKICSKQILAKF